MTKITQEYKILSRISKSEKHVINISEDFAKKMNTVAHHYDHADRVRIEAVELGKSENLNHRDLFLLEVVALWHDIGLDYIKDRSKHPDKSADMFLKTFPDVGYFSKQEKENIIFMLKYHDKYKLAKSISTDIKLLKLLRILIDADTLELFGERGYQRALETAESRSWPKYNSNNPKGETFRLNSKQFDERFALKREGKLINVIEPSLVGQINFQISCADLLFTKAAKIKGKNAVLYLRNKLKLIVS